MWSASVVMALATIVKRTGVKPLDHCNAFQVMLSYMYLEKGLCKYLVSEIEMSVRSVYICEHINMLVE